MSVIISQSQINDVIQKLSQGKETLLYSVSQQVSPPSNALPVRDVHVYDRTIEYKVEVPIYEKTSKTTLLDEVRKILPSKASEMIHIIQSNNTGNIDGQNGYVADDLLVYLLLNGHGEDFALNLKEQLDDAYTLGQCPQGRVIRLISLVNAFV